MSDVPADPMSLLRRNRAESEQDGAKRTIDGLRPRQQSAPRFVADAPPTEPAPQPASPAPTPAPAQKSITAINVRIPTDLRKRARAAYRATIVTERDGSFSNFVARAIEAEITRREQLYNDGERFPEDEQPLGTGKIY